MAKLTFNGMLIEGTVEELSELMQKVGGSGAEIAEDGELKVGDYAKIIDVIHSSLDVGYIVEIKSVDLDDEILSYKVKHIADGGEWWVSAKEIVKATDEEVAKAKADAKLAKLGRKPGEFKKGDIVRVIEDTGASSVGEIVELVEDGAESYRDKDGDIFSGGPEWFELVAPVESRVDTE